MNEKSKEQINAQQQNLIPPIPEVYANAGMVNTSPYEFEITLGLGSSNYQGVKPVVNLRMSPVFAKELAKLLVDNINLFEENHGKIKLPKNVEEEKN